MSSPGRLSTLNGSGGNSSWGGSHQVVTAKGDFHQENGKFASVTGRMLPPSKPKQNLATLCLEDRQNVACSCLKSEWKLWQITSTYTLGRKSGPAQSRIPGRLWPFSGDVGNTSPGRNILGSHQVVTAKGDFPQEKGKFASVTGRMLPPSKA